jgi:hypothetical protein
MIVRYFLGAARGDIQSTPATSLLRSRGKTLLSDNASGRLARWRALSSSLNRQQRRALLRKRGVQKTA